MAVDVLKWLKEDMKFSDDEIKDLAPRFQADGRADLLEKGYLRVQDYSKKMDEGKAALKTQQDELSAANDRLTAEMADWAVARANGEAQTASQIKAR